MLHIVSVFCEEKSLSIKSVDKIVFIKVSCQFFVWDLRCFIFVFGVIPLFDFAFAKELRCTTAGTFVLRVE